MFASVSVTPRITRINTKCEKLIEALETIAEIESTEQHQSLLLHISELIEELPCEARNLMNLMRNHCSDLDDFAGESYSIVLTEVLVKFGKSHRAGDDVPVEIVSLVSITDNLDFIFEAMNALSDVKQIEKSSHFIVQLLEKLLMDDNYLIFAFARMSRTELGETSVIKTEHFIQQLVSLPDKIANKFQTEFSKTFGLRTFYATLMVNALKSLHTSCQINKMEQSNVYSMNFLSMVISKIFVHFTSDKTVLTSSLRLMSSLAGEEVYQENIRELMSRLKRSAIETVVLLAFGNFETKQKLTWMFGDVWKTSSDWKFALTKKLPLLSFSTDDRIVDNLAFFLATEDEKTMEQLLMELMMVWSTKSHVNDTTFEQHFYVTKFIVLMTKYLPNPKDHTEKMKKILFDGIKVHLESSDKKVQALGMITAETILGILETDMKEEEKLKFDYSEVDPKIAQEVVQVIKDFPLKAVSDETLEALEGANESEVLAEMEFLMSIVQDRESVKNIHQVLKIVQESKVSMTVKAPIIKPQQIDLDSDDDDDLQAYDDPDDLPRHDEKRPKYLLDLIQAFTSKENLDDPEKFELSLTSAEEIIKQQLPSHHTDIAVDLLRIFISLDKTVYFENFDELKMKLLIEICSIHPKECSQYLCQEFNSEATKYSTSRRILMLEVLAEAAKILSKLELKQPEEIQALSSSGPAQSQNKLLIKLNEELDNRNKKDAQKIIRQRLMAKTRRITTRTKAPDEDAGINRFSDVAGWFFFPLVHGFGRKQMIFKTGTNLKDDIDNLLLLKFLNTISVLILCAENSVLVPKMAKEIVGLSVFLRYHQESKIRLAVLHMVATIILAVPRKVLVNEFSHEINEFVNHLSMIVKSSVVNYEPDKECREFAKQLIGMFRETLYTDE